MSEWAAANNVELTYTPTYASWLNRIEAKFQALRYLALDGTDHAPQREQALPEATPSNLGLDVTPGQSLCKVPRRARRIPTRASSATASAASQVNHVTSALSPAAGTGSASPAASR